MTPRAEGCLRGLGAASPGASPGIARVPAPPGQRLSVIEGFHIQGFLGAAVAALGQGRCRAKGGLLIKRLAPAGGLAIGLRLEALAGGRPLRGIGLPSFPLAGEGFSFKTVGFEVRTGRLKTIGARPLCARSP